MIVICRWNLYEYNQWYNKEGAIGAAKKKNLKGGKFKFYPRQIFLPHANFFTPGAKTSCSDTAKLYIFCEFVYSIFENFVNEMNCGFICCAFLRLSIWILFEFLMNFVDLSTWCVVLQFLIIQIKFQMQIKQ